MKKLLAITLSIIIVLSGMPAFASHGAVHTGKADIFLSANPAYESAQEKLADGIRKCKTVVDLSQYRIPLEEISDFYLNIIRNYPEFFHISNQYQYCLTEDEKYLSYFLPVYKIPNKVAYNTALAEVEAEANDILLSVKDSMDDFEKALILHDKIVEYYSYDDTYTSSDIYTFIKTKKGVCQAYSLFYKYLLDKCGIENAFAESNKINHLWNLVKLGDSWYNVDVAWDDPIFTDPAHDVKGIVHHNYFLNSDANEYEAEHLTTYADYPCTDTRYENKQYRDILSPFVYVDDALYCFDKGICTYDCETDGKNCIYPENVKWSTENSYYTDSFSGLSRYGDYLVYNTPTKIKAYSLISKDSQTLLTPDTAKGKVFGIVLRLNTVTYSITPNYGTLPKEYTFTITGLEKPEFNFPFIDVSQNGDWIHKAVKYVYENSLMSGTSKVFFSPSSLTSRAMLVQILYNLEGRPSTEDMTNPFVDVPEGAWHEKAIKWGYNSKLVYGIDSSHYSPDMPITREEFVCILYRYANYKGVDVDATVDMSKYTDFRDASTFAKTSLVWANAKKYITGMSETVINPHGYATRAQCASIIMRYHKDNT